MTKPAGVIDGDLPVWDSGSSTWVRASTKGISSSFLSGGTVPTGALLQYGATSAPTGWVLCDGSSLLRASFSALFGVLGTSYGSVDGTTFNVPDLRGRMPVGYASGGHTDVATLGNNDGSVLASRRPKHKHTVNDPGHVHPYNGDQGVFTGVASATMGGNGAYINTQSASTGITVGIQTSAPTDGAAYIVVNYIIKT